MFKREYYLTEMHACLNVIVVFFYLNLYMCLCGLGACTLVV